MLQSSFGDALSRLWPHGDMKITGLCAAITRSAPVVFAAYGLDTPLLVAHVMAQISHECGAGREVVENLNYTAARMMQVWPARFPTPASAQPYADNPRALANKVYNGRMGNVVGSDDGWNFRGRGAVQTTGREGYRRLAALTGLDLIGSPDLVNDPQHFLECGVADFILCGCLPLAKADNLVGVTKRLNGGTVGLAAREQWLAQWKAALRDVPIVVAGEPSAPVPPDANDAGPPQLASWPSIVSKLIAAIVAAFRRT